MNEAIEDENQVEEEDETYFFDTYAMIEIIRGNPKYSPYTKSAVITAIFNLAELNYNLKKEMSKEKANKYTEDYFDFLVDVSLEDLKEAMDLKIKYKDLSIPDVIGYVVAKSHGVKFLTGDEGFRYFDNVEFVKK